MPASALSDNFAKGSVPSLKVESGLAAHPLFGRFRRDNYDAVVKELMGDQRPDPILIPAVLTDESMPAVATDYETASSSLYRLCHDESQLLFSNKIQQGGDIAKDHRNSRENVKDREKNHEAKNHQDPLYLRALRQMLVLSKIDNSDTKALEKAADELLLRLYCIWNILEKEKPQNIIRRAGHPDWLQLTGLLHDMGKIMFLWGTGEEGQDGYSPDGKQWALGGDTFVVGCQIPHDAIIFPEFNILNPDMHNEKYNTLYGMYEPHCGLDSLCFAWGHDEYMYRMLVANNTTIPREGLDMIRYHSAYCLHDKGAYKHLLKLEDEDRLDWVRLFNKFDLYTKDGSNDLRTSIDELLPYYRGLLEKYNLGGKLKW